MEKVKVEISAKTNSTSRLEKKLFYAFLRCFYHAWLESLQKNANMTQKFIFSKKSIRVSKDAEFNAEFKSTEKNCKKL